MTSMDRRRGSRIPLPSPLRGLMDGRTEVCVIDLGPGGAMVEHTEPLTPGGTCTLLLELPEEDLLVETTVAWCSIAGTRSACDGGPEVFFSSGLDFGALAEGPQVALQAYLASLPTPPAEEVLEPAPAVA